MYNIQRTHFFVNTAFRHQIFKKNKKLYLIFKKFHFKMWPLFQITTNYNQGQYSLNWFFADNTKNFA